MLIKKINDWVDEYNSFRSHSSLKQMTPEKFIKRYEIKAEAIDTLSEMSLQKVRYFAAVELGST